MTKKVTSGEIEESERKSKAKNHLTPEKYLRLIADKSFLEGDWRNQALCFKVCSLEPDNYEPDDWFPSWGALNPKTKSSSIVPVHVAAICRDCEVRLECLAYAMRTKQTSGVWAGKSEIALKQIRKRLREALAKMGVRLEGDYREPNYRIRPFSSSPTFRA